MPVVIAVWENNTVSVIGMRRGFSMLDLWFEIDAEANPLDATCYLAKPSIDGMYITFDWKDRFKAEAIACATSKNIAIGKLSGKLKRLNWPADIMAQVFKSMDRDARRAKLQERCRFLLASEIPDMPRNPPPEYSVQDVRNMEPFCGVYFSYDRNGSCFYVGESLNVPNRVSKSRPEIGDRMLGVLRCHKHDRKRLEAWFVSILDPPGNAISTHRMALKEQHCDN